MLKALPNLIFILILFVIATVLPFGMDIFTLDLSQPVVETITDNTQLIQSYLELSLVSRQENQLRFELSHPPVTDFADHFVLSLNGNKGGRYEKILSDLSYQLDSEALILHVDLSPYLKELPSDYYLISLEAREGDFFKARNLIHMEYLDATHFDFTYYGSGNQLPTGQTAFTLFLPNADYTALVPITRFVRTPENRWLALYANLRAGTKEGLGLAQGMDTVPPASNFLITNKIANIYWNSAHLGPFDSRLALTRESVAKTLLKLGYITAVDFHVDNQHNSQYGDLDWTKTFLPETQPKAYVAYQGDSEYAFLIPVDVSVSSSDAIELQVERLWQALRFKEIDLHPNMLQLVHPDLNYKSFTLENGILTFDFQTEWLSAYESDSNLFKAFIESIVYTFTTIEGVDAVAFHSGGIKAQGIHDISFDAPLRPNAYINLEP